MQQYRIGEALRLIRVFHDMSRKELVDRIGISNSYLSEIESRKKPASFDLIERYSNAFNIPVSSIIFFSEQLDSDSPSDSARDYLANKILKMLEWIEDKETLPNGTPS